jgi:hypothetical protein
MPISFQPISMPMFWLISESHRSGKIDQCQKKRPNTGEHSRPTVGGIGNDHPLSPDLSSNSKIWALSG